MDNFLNATQIEAYINHMNTFTEEQKAALRTDIIDVVSFLQEQLEDNLNWALEELVFDIWKTEDETEEWE